MADLNNSTDTVVWCQKEQFEISVYIFKLTNSLLKFKKTFSTFFSRRQCCGAGAGENTPASGHYL